ncbi:MAG: disulfide bond formation protein B [Beijerinckiaceae bacterium]|nr:disulfide bond formation protein B [Beijerinckiaceae bacterium]
MPDRLAVYLNSLGLLALCGALGFALFDQIVFHELPCPLCLLQRMAMFAAGVGLVLNISVQHAPRHYGIIIISSVIGMFMAIRQILLHIVPGTGAYGDPFLGLHFYTWAFLLFVGMIAGASLMLMIMRQSGSEARQTTPWLGTFAIGLFTVLVVANVIGTTLECGGGACPDDPTSYEYLDLLLGNQHVK